MASSTLPDDERSASTWLPLLHALGSHRGVVIGYLVVMAAWLLMIVSSGIGMIPEIFHEIVGAEVQPDAGNDGLSQLGRLGILCVFLLLQAAFLWGGGRIELRKRPTRFRNVVVSLIIFGTLMSVLSYGLIICFYEMIHQFEGSWLTGENGGTAFGKVWVGGWILWTVVGWLAVRGRTHHGALSRLTTVLLAGSWVEFTVALPVELVTRPRTEDCPCASGSWLALLICVPVLLWTIGPAVILLYLWQRGLSEQDPRHAASVLLAKSRFRSPRR